MSQQVSTINLLLIGFGPHAKRIYHPLLEIAAEDPELNLCCAVDLESAKENIKFYIEDKNVKPEMIYLENGIELGDELPLNLAVQLNEAVQKHSINGVIIASEPLIHLAYATWALNLGLSVLMDKPISSYIGVSTSLDKAKKIANDYYQLNCLYQKQKKIYTNQVFSMMAQRRHQTSFDLIKKKISDCFAQTNCPVTNVQTFHSDGQWRMPTEIVEQYYHGYNQGYGKCSHSGYHYFDIIPFILESGLGGNKFYDNIEVFSHAARPLDVINQFSLDDYKKLFGELKFNQKNKYETSQLQQLMQNFGEVDCNSNICFKQGDARMTLVSINLAHNGYSQRDWVSAEGRDLYKGNGRIAHESHIIQQGPFQTIHFHSYKSDESVEESGREELIGTNKHLEIYVFRNHKMLGGKHVEVFNVDDLIEMEGGHKGITGKSKAKVFYEFLDGMRGNISTDDIKSDFGKHEAGAVITSAVYQSLCLQNMSKNPLVKMMLKMGHSSPVIQKKLLSAVALNN